MTFQIARKRLAALALTIPKLKRVLELKYSKLFLVCVFFHCFIARVSISKDWTKHNANCRQVRLEETERKMDVCTQTRIWKSHIHFDNPLSEIVCLILQSSKYPLSVCVNTGFKRLLTLNLSKMGNLAFKWFQHVDLIKNIWTYKEMAKSPHLKKAPSKRIYIIVSWPDVIELSYTPVEVTSPYSAVFNVPLFVSHVIPYLSYSLKSFSYCHLRDAKTLNNTHLNNYISLATNDKINISSSCTLLVLTP